ncbi:MAG: cytochrome P450, partial [Pseudomonadota bacterium]
RVRESVPAIWAATQAAQARLARCDAGNPVELEAMASHAAADVIFRTLFSLPIEHRDARAVFEAFRRYQRAQPLVNLAAFLPLPRWVPRGHGRRMRAAAAEIRGLIARLVLARQAEIDAGTAPEDLATKIMTTRDPVTGDLFTPAETVDQVAIFFLAGHETSASTLAWALWLLAADPEVQHRVAAEARSVLGDAVPDMAAVSRLTVARQVFREALRLYPPVPMMVREATKPERFRDRAVPVGSQIVVSPWHLHRHQRQWEAPDAFDPDRWGTGRSCPREAYLPFSTGRRVCPGAGFAMAEGVLLLAGLMRDLEVGVVPGRRPVPVAHLTVRARDGIWVTVRPRA